MQCYEIKASHTGIEAALLSCAGLEHNTKCNMLCQPEFQLKESPQDDNSGEENI